MATYKLAVKGEILGDHSPDDVRANVAKLFKQDVESDQIKALFSGKAVVIKKGLDKDQAEKFVAALHNAGLKTYAVSEQEPAALESAATPVPEHAPTPAPDALEQQTAVPAAMEEQQAEPSAESSLEPPQEASEISTHGSAPQETPSESTPVSPEVDKSPTQVSAASKADDAVGEYNPYQQPQADLDVETEEGDFTLVEPNKLSFGDGWGWISEGYSLFRMQPGIWVGTFVVFFIINMVLSILPIIQIAANLLLPVFSAGFMIGAYKLYSGDSFEFGDLFAGFKHKTGQLLVVGLLYVVGIIVISVAMVGMVAATVGMSAMNDMAGGAPGPMFLIAMLIGFSLIMVLMMAYWFAPALVVFNEDIGAIQAMQMSFTACLRNIMPFLLYGIAGLVLGLLAMIPFGLGLLIWGPIFIASMFAAYRQIFTNTDYY